VQDHEAYILYPHHRKWFNKLWFSEAMGYRCAPAGIAPDASGWYISRPITNLLGMGLGAKKVFIEKGDFRSVGPGDFWCEWFEGIQYSVDFVRVRDKWVQKKCYRAERDVNNLIKFKRWSLYDHKIFSLGEMFDELKDVKEINVEFIDDRPFEVHLRTSEDPSYEELIPIWLGEENMIDIYKVMGYKYIESHEDCDGFLDTPRIGFMTK
jgi:hypothetical protein